MLDGLAALLQLAVESDYPRYDSLLLLAELVRQFRPERVLELGVYKGCSTVFMAKALKSDATITAVDDFTLVRRDQVRATLVEHGVSDRVALIEADTRHVREHLEGEFDFVFFDASHTNEDVIAELDSVAPRLARRAVLVFDDALHINAALAEIGAGHQGMRSYNVHFGMCVIVRY